MRRDTDPNRRSRPCRDRVDPGAGRRRLAAYRPHSCPDMGDVVHYLLSTLLRRLAPAGEIEAGSKEGQRGVDLAHERVPASRATVAPHGISISPGGRLARD